MINKRVLDYIVQKLQSKSPITLFFEEVMLTLACDQHNLFIQALVYEGEDYIPPSVRKAVATSPKRKGLSPTFLIDEEKYTITLHIGEKIEDRSLALSVCEALPPFALLASEWRERLRERGHEDLLFIYQRR